MKHGADTLICGGIGGAQTALAEAGIRLYGGVSGDADTAVTELLSGKLNYNPMYSAVTMSIMVKITLWQSQLWE